MSQPGDDPRAELSHQLAELDEIRRRVLNVVGHALRTPMATLRGLTEVLDGDPDPATRQRVVDALVRTTRRLERLLDDVLLASDVTTRLPTSTPRDLRLADAIDQVWRELGAPAELVIEGDPDTRVLAGSDGLRWMLWHLLDNAARYGAGPVTAHLASEDGRSRVEVSSPGEPLPPADLARAFELFYRGETAVTSVATGMGIGLPVARRLAAHAGGTVELRSGDSGVTAVLWLPRPGADAG